MADNLLNAILGITPSRAAVQPETGMFGVSPYDAEQQRYAQDAAFADKYAQMAPFAKAESQLARAGGGIGRSVGGMMGLVDPRVEQAKQQQSIQAQIDHNSVEGLLKGAQLFNAAGNPRMAFMYTQAAQAQKAKEQSELASKAEISRKSAAELKDLALAEKALRENPNLMAIEVGVKGKPGWMQKVLFDKTKPESPYQEIGDPYLSAAAAKQTFHVSTGGSESKQPLAYVDKDGNVKWGTMTEARGMTPAMYDPVTKQMVSSAGAVGKEIGEASGKAAATLPGMSDTISSVKKNVQDLLNHPGFSGAVGATMLPGMRFVPGSNQASFMDRLEQVKGGAFLKAYETLKGGGQITEIEGKKATAAINRMEISSSEKEFKSAAEDFISAIESGVKKLEKQAAMAKPVAGKGGGEEIWERDSSGKLVRRK